VRIGNDSVTAAKKAEGAQEVSEHCALRITGQSWLSRDMKGRFFNRDQLNGDHTMRAVCGSGSGKSYCCSQC
jgi:hypothetical protein